MMTHYYQINPDGAVHITNAVMGYLGQHHVHTAEEFITWSQGALGKLSKLDECADCDCGLKPGESKHS